MRSLAILLAALAVAQAPAPSVVVLTDDDAPLVDHFNANSDHLRFLAILSPT
jgi:hypothetical protein